MLRLSYADCKFACFLLLVSTTKLVVVSYRVLGFAHESIRVLHAGEIDVYQSSILQARVTTQQL